MKYFSSSSSFALISSPSCTRMQSHVHPLPRETNVTHTLRFWKNFVYSSAWVQNFTQLTLTLTFTLFDSHLGDPT